MSITFEDKSLLYTKYHINYADALHRLNGSEALYNRFLYRYLDTTFCMDLVESLLNHHYEKALDHAHALKEISGNLSLTEIYRISSKILDKLQTRSYNTLHDTIPDLITEHRLAVSGIQLLKKKEKIAV